MLMSMTNMSEQSAKSLETEGSGEAVVLLAFIAHKEDGTRVRLQVIQEAAPHSSGAIEQVVPPLRQIIRLADGGCLVWRLAKGHYVNVHTNEILHSDDPDAP